MAAKLKKRALAEYQSQVEIQDEKKANKKLKLLLPPKRTDSISSSTSRRLSSSVGDLSPNLEPLVQQIVTVTPAILDRSMAASELGEFAKKLMHSVQKSDDEGGNQRMQIYLALANVVRNFDANSVPLEFHEDWLQAQFETSGKAKCALFSLFACWLSSGRSMSTRQVFSVKTAFHYMKCAIWQKIINN